MTNDTKDNNFTATNFNSNLVDLYVDASDEQTILVAPREATAAPVAQQSPLTRDLSAHPLAGRLSEWWLSTTESTDAEFDPEHVIGAIVRNRAGKTSPIVAVDPQSRRIQTRSGSVYALDVPQLNFAARGRHVLRKLGF